MSNVYDFPIQVIDNFEVVLNGENFDSGLHTTIAKDKKVIVKVDDDSNDSRILGLVSSDYDVITHKESVEPIENVLRNMYDDSASIPTTISVQKNGARFRAVYTLPEQYTIGKDDIVNPTVTVTNSYDGSHGLNIRMGAFRVICSNGQIVGFADDYSTIHMKGRGIQQYRDDAEPFIKQGIEDVVKECGLWSHWNDTQFNQSYSSFEKELVDTFDSYTKDDNNKVPVRRNQILNYIAGEMGMQDFHSWMNGDNFAEPTIWHVYNGLTEYATKGILNADGFEKKSNTLFSQIPRARLVRNFMEKNDVFKSNQIQ